MTECPHCFKPAEDTRCTHCGIAFSPGGYQVESVIRQTPHGRVYRAADISGQQFAIKEIVFVNIPTLQVLDGFEKEAKILQTIDHPHIPNFVAYFSEGEGVGTRLYLVQEFVKGLNLEEELKWRRFTENDAKKTMRQLLLIVEYLQTLSPPIFHRDIKPSNVMIQRNGLVFLVDFGAARDTGATVGATQVGTFGYMPSEQLAGIVNKSTDVYAIGMTILECLVRKKPWEISIEKALQIANISSEFRALLTKMLEVDVDMRCADATTTRLKLDYGTQLQTVDNVVKNEPRVLVSSDRSKLVKWLYSPSTTSILFSGLMGVIIFMISLPKMGFGIGAISALAMILFCLWLADAARPRPQ